MTGQLRVVAIAFGLALGSAADAEEFITAILPPGCQVSATPDERLCEPQTMLFDLGSLGIMSAAPMRMMAGAEMGTWGLHGPIGLPGDSEGVLMARSPQDITATGSIPSLRTMPAGDGR